MLSDKYQIRNNIDLCFNIKANNTLNLLSDDPSLQNIIIYGPEGSGKKTLVNLFLKQLYNENVFNLTECNYDIDDTKTKLSIPLKQSAYHLVINANNVKNNSVLLQIINKYTSLYHFNMKNKFKFNEIVIYDVDKLSKPIQLALRRIIESTAKNHRFIFTCSNVSSLIDPIVSRCNILKVYPPTKNELLDVILKISYREHFLIEPDNIVNIVNKANHNVSRCLLYLQSIISNYNLMDDYTENINRILTIIKTQKDITNINEIQKIVYSILSSHISYKNIIEDILMYFMENNYNLEVKRQILQQASYFDIKCIQCNNKNMHLCNFIRNIIIILIQNNQ